jgi:hypothetical protein
MLNHSFIPGVNVYKITIPRLFVKNVIHPKGELIYL